MTCRDVLDRLDDYVDGELPEAEFQEVELHLASCAGCASEERFLRELLEQASRLPRAIAPPRDLWPGVASRLGARAQPRTYWMAGLAAAAALLVALTLTLRPTRVDVSRPDLPPELAKAELDYERATAQLMAALESRRASLPPETVRALDANLRAIDQALVDVRAAVLADPSNPHLNHLLASTHQRKVETLRRVVKLTT